jgi:hypothetical protein
VSKYEYEQHYGDTFTHTKDHIIKQLVETANESLPYPEHKLSKMTKVNFIDKQMS